MARSWQAFDDGALQIAADLDDRLAKADFLRSFRDRVTV
jgi:hypothetical protein